MSNDACGRLPKRPHNVVLPGYRTQLSSLPSCHARPAPRGEPHGSTSVGVFLLVPSYEYVCIARSSLRSAVAPSSRGHRRWSGTQIGPCVNVTQLPRTCWRPEVAKAVQHLGCARSAIACWHRWLCQLSPLWVHGKSGVAYTAVWRLGAVRMRCAVFVGPGCSLTFAANHRNVADLHALRDGKRPSSSLGFLFTLLSSSGTQFRRCLPLRC